MAQKITPFLWFENNCEEALNFYASIFKNSKIKTIQRYPEGDNLPDVMKGMQGKVLTAIFELEGQEFMALDGGPNVFAKSGVVSFLVDCKDQAEIDYYWEKLTVGSDPKTWQCGWLQDKYGFYWQIVPNMDKWLNDPNKEKADRAMKAMLEMKKIVIADLEKAYEGS